MSRFDWRYELSNIETGMQRDLQRTVGQTVDWWVYDGKNTVVDDIYDVGDTTTGRTWLTPVKVRVLSAIKVEATETPNDRGLYLIDTLRLALSVADARAAGLSDLVFNPEAHVLDRVVYEGRVFGLGEVRTRGVLTADYAVLGVDASEVKPEEMVNDSQFRAYSTEPVRTVEPARTLYPSEQQWPENHTLYPETVLSPSSTTFPED